MCGQHIADQLIREIQIFAARKQVSVEDFREIAISFDDTSSLALKIGFGEFRLNQQVPDLHIDLGAIKAAVGQRHACPDAEAGLSLGRDAEQGSESWQTK